MRSLVLVLTFIVIQSFAAAAHSVPQAALPFHLTLRGGVIVRVSLDGRREASFLVDTGSNGSAISESLASELALPVVARTTLMSGIGQKPRLVTRIEHLTIGGLSIDGVLATLLPDKDLELSDAAGRHLQGIVGQDVLANLRYTIDYRARRIRWLDAAMEAPKDAAVLTLEPRDDRFLVLLPQGRATLKLVPDSGAEGLVLFERGDADRAVSDRVMVTGVAGSGEGKQARLDRLRIGSTVLTDVPVVVVNGAAAAARADGLLPLHLFERVTFNAPERQLIIETSPTRKTRSPDD